MVMVLVPSVTMIRGANVEVPMRVFRLKYRHRVPKIVADFGWNLWKGIYSEERYHLIRGVPYTTADVPIL